MLHYIIIELYFGFFQEAGEGGLDGKSALNVTAYSVTLLLWSVTL